MSDSPAYRVSDHQRERAAEEIREHFAAGRLSEEEMSDRLGAAYRAKTDQELSAIRADLPALPATPAQQKAEIAQRRAHLQRRLLQQTGGGLSVFAVCTVIYFAAGSHRGQFWPIWILIVVLMPLLRSGWQLYGPAPELDRVERQLEHRDRHRDRQDRHRRRQGRRGGPPPV
ncbi:MAG: DUF1707 domain-containing protein [Actinomycetota bacterium]|nr:DUF1707 domain-containing protein [Actinomycetota bacterium]